MAKDVNRSAAQTLPQMPDPAGTLLRRRYVLTAGILALALVWSPAGLIAWADQPAASPSPATVSTYLGMQVEAAYTRATRLASEMRLLYQITRLQELKLDAGRATNNDSQGRVILCKESTPVESGRKSRT